MIQKSGGDAALEPTAQRIVYALMDVGGLDREKALAVLLRIVDALDQVNRNRAKRTLEVALRIIRHRS